MRFVSAAAAGLLFGLGLAISGMINPAKVLAFLDVAGDWDPSLAFVMGAAVLVAAGGLRLVARWSKPLCAAAFAPAGRSVIDARLLAGAALFGAGWGWVGYCPGPALAGLGLGVAAAWLFVPAMLAGMLAARFWP